MRLTTIAAMIATTLLCAPAIAQNVATLPAAATLGGAERILAAQGTGCVTNVAPCLAVSVTPAQLAAFLAPTFQPADADLAAIAALSTTPFGRGILTLADAPTTRSYLGLGTNATDSMVRLAAANNLSDLASVVTARTNLGVTATGADPAYAKLTGATFVGAIAGTSASFSGVLSASNFSGSSSNVNTGDQTSVSGNAGTSTKLANARILAITGDLAWTSPAFDGSANVTAVGTLATVNSNVGTFGSATAVAIPTVNAKGLITGMTTATIGSATIVGTGAAASTLFDAATNDNYVSARLFRNSSTVAATNDGMYIGYGNTNAGPTRLYGGGSTGAAMVVSAGAVATVLTNTMTLGTTALFWSATYSLKHCYTATVCDYAGSGTPLGNLVAAIGSTYRRTDGGLMSTFYVKESGSDASGWVAK